MTIKGITRSSFSKMYSGKNWTFGGQKYDRMIPDLECFGKNKVSLIEFDIVLVNGKSVAIFVPMM